MVGRERLWSAETRFELNVHIKKKGKIEAVDLVTMLSTEMQTEKPYQKIVEIVETLKTYPQVYSIFQKSVEKTLKNLGKLKEII